MCHWLGSHFEIGLMIMGLHFKGVYASIGSHILGNTTTQTFSLRIELSLLHE